MEQCTSLAAGQAVGGDRRSSQVTQLSLALIFKLVKNLYHVFFKNEWTFFLTLFFTQIPYILYSNSDYKYEQFKLIFCHSYKYS